MSYTIALLYILEVFEDNERSVNTCISDSQVRYSVAVSKQARKKNRGTAVRCEALCLRAKMFCLLFVCIVCVQVHRTLFLELRSSGGHGARYVCGWASSSFRTNEQAAGMFLLLRSIFFWREAGEGRTAPQPTLTLNYSSTVMSLLRGYAGANSYSLLRVVCVRVQRGKKHRAARGEEELPQCSSTRQYRTDWPQELVRNRKIIHGERKTPFVARKEVASRLRFDLLLVVQEEMT